MRYTVIKQHRSTFPEPLEFSKGALLTVTEKYTGPENWDNWYFCTASEGKGGWVPGQIIHWLETGAGQALEDYCARELDIDEGDMLLGLKTLNGWLWCQKLQEAETGWVPLENLHREDE